MNNTDTDSTFGCTEPDCGRKFHSKEKLNEHYLNRHPGVEYKDNTQEAIRPTDAQSMKLQTLYSQIKSLESVIEEETMHQYNLDNMSNYDILASLSSSDEEKEVKTASQQFQKMLSEPTAFKSEDKTASDMTSSGKVIEVTEEMIGIGLKYENYLDIKDIDLSRHNLAVFRDKTQIPFNSLSEVAKLNIAFNWLTYSYDLRYFTKLQELHINDNKIDDLTFCESLPLLEVLNAENNEICNVTALMKCPMLQILLLGQNQISYETSTLKTIYYLKNLRELTINNNPFVDSIFGYRHLFIYKFPWILVLDKVKIEDVSRDLAKKFTMENNPSLAQFRPNTAQPSTRASCNDNDIESGTSIVAEREIEPPLQTQTQFRVGNTIITKEVRVPKVDKPKLEKKRLPQINPEQREMNELKRENKELKDKVEQQEKEIHTLRLQLENMSQVDKENEMIIARYKQEQLKTQDTEKVKLLHQIDVLKREYVDLLDRTASTTNTSANVIIDSRARPQTAQVKTTRSTDFENVLEQLKTIKRKNLLLDDSLEEESNEDQSNTNDNEGDNKGEDSDYDSDAEIDELCRKSYQNLQEMKSDLKELEKQYDQQKVIPPSTNSNIITPVKKPSDHINSTMPSNITLTNKPLISKNIKLASVAESKPLPQQIKDEQKGKNTNLFRKNK